MRHVLIVLTGTGVLLLSLLAGSIALNGGIPGVQAISLMQAMPMMYGDGQHGDMDCPSGHDMAQGTMGHSMHDADTCQEMASDGVCPHDGDMPQRGMHRMMHGNDGRHVQHMMQERECPFHAD